MREFTLNTKYIHNKYVMCAAIINCIYTAISDADKNDIKSTHTYNMQKIIGLSRNMLYIMGMNMNPEEFFGGKYSGLESIVDAACFHNIEQSVKEVEDIVDEQIVININSATSLAQLSDLMQYVPKFNKDKICIKYT